jgi:hypothetical protein
VNQVEEGCQYQERRKIVVIFDWLCFIGDKLASTRRQEGRDVHWGEANGDVSVFLLPNIAIIPFAFFAESVATTGAESWNISNTLVRSFAGLSRFGVEGADGRLVDLCLGGD